MPNRLQNLMVTRVALVDRGANQKADIVLFKRDSEMDPFIKRTFSADDRKRLAASGAARSDGSFPIENESDLKNAISAVGRAKDPAAAKAHIISRAKSLGLTKLLPSGWTSSKAADVEKELTDLETAEKEGRKVSAERLKQLRAFRDNLAALITEVEPTVKANPTAADVNTPGAVGAVRTAAQSGMQKCPYCGAMNPADATQCAQCGKALPAAVTRRKEDSMPEIDKSALAEDVRTHIESLEQRASDAEKKAEDAAKALDEAKKSAEPPKEEEKDIFKGLDPELRKRFEENEKRAEKAEELAKSEVEKRETAEVQKRLEAYKAAGVDPEKFAPAFRQLEKADPETAKTVEEQLSAASERIRTGDLFREYGKSAGEFGTDSVSKLDKLTKSYAEANKVTEAEALDAVMQTPEGKQAYNEYVNKQREEAKA